jgi:hypothetical protein
MKSKKRQDFRTEIVYIEGGEKSIANIKSLVSTLDLHKHTPQEVEKTSLKIVLMQSGL